MSAHEKPRAPLPAEAMSLPARYYLDEDHYARELERLFLARWFYIGRADEVPNRGDYVLREAADESLIVTRGDDGRVRAFFNVCRHRGTRLCEQPSGTFTGAIRCPYHAWAYDLSGRLLGAPSMDQSPHFRAEDYPLVEARADVWDGHLFLNFAAAPPPLGDQLGALVAKFRPWKMEELRLAHRIVYDVAANWKLVIQNYSECLHCPGVHPALQRLSHFLSGENSAPTDAYLGGSMDLRDGVETLSRDGRLVGACVPGLAGDDLRRVHYYAVLPNLLLSLHPDYMMTHRLRPQGVGRTEIVCEWHFRPEAADAPEFDPQGAVEFWDLTNRQDWHVCEQMQLGLASRAYRPGPYSPREDLLFAFDRLVRGAE
ncbi:aromatic ring-hydroxylating oxygenase subunit alpha [Paludisphaera mucosa]|uniref:Aromatic ring-hydroxylating dioxygenase subunit alpha n=1 Tax=Paludisphaera mucosa TaxID=3030827 RepID=A0ABT6FE32_9BACT|nr:aromatic ring-hydroxylating dioxygenase subunit alpha [Paludisphaera mucosa]MDG3005756.1 aromatic ring-hydroxylating dioxygenase subunit alpha [Paludisphaera mucosa]